MKKTATAIGVCVALVLTTSPAVGRAAVEPAVDEQGGDVSPEQGDVDALVADAVEKFQAKEYDAAAALFERAYDLSPEPNYLFNIGRVYEEKGDYANAIVFYERFVTQPAVDIDARELAAERLRVMKEIQAQVEPEPSDEPEPPEPEPKPKQDEDTGPQKTPRLRVAGYALLGVGAAALATGTGFGIAAVQRQRDLDGLRGVDARNDSIDRGKRNALIADSMFIAGGALALTGLILALVSLRKKSKNRSASAVLAPAVGPHGSSARVTFRF